MSDQMDAALKDMNCDVHIDAERKVIHLLLKSKKITEEFLVEGIKPALFHPDHQLLVDAIYTYFRDAGQKRLLTREAYTQYLLDSGARGDTLTSLTVFDKCLVGVYARPDDAGLLKQQLKTAYIARKSHQALSEYAEQRTNIGYENSAVLLSQRLKDLLDSIDSPSTWVPFPTSVLPVNLATFITKAAKAINCDEAYIALPLLTALAAAIGNSCQIELKEGWVELAIIWAAIVGHSSTGKSPALDAALRPLREYEVTLDAAFQQEWTHYESDLLAYDKAVTQWKRSKLDDAPIKPTEPKCPRVMTTDSTAEALVNLLRDNPRGIMLARDELAGWIKSFDQYKQAGKGGDLSNWLECWRGGHFNVDRTSKKPVRVSRASVNVTGGIQPGVLASLLTPAMFECGFAARLLLASPPRGNCEYTEDTLDCDQVAAFKSIIQGLLSLPCGSEPVTLKLGNEAKTVWMAFQSRWSKKKASTTDERDLAALGKLDAYAARFALILQCVKGGSEIDVESMKSGVALSEWFANETLRLYSLAQKQTSTSKIDKVLEFIRRKGSATARQVQQYCHISKQEAQTRLTDLETRKLLEAEEIKAPNGKPIKQWSHVAA